MTTTEMLADAEQLLRDGKPSEAHEVVLRVVEKVHAGTPIDASEVAWLNQLEERTESVCTGAACEFCRE